MTPKVKPAELRSDGFTPTPDQHLLLRAALCPINAFEAAYAEWEAAVAARGIDLGALQVAQLLAPRVRQMTETPLIRMIREQYRLTWVRTNLTLRKQPAAIRRLQDAGLEVLALKGAALVPLYYRDSGLRIVGDLDVLLRPDKVEAAAAILAEDGWRRAIAEEEYDPRFAHALTLENGAGGSVDIHAHVSSLNTTSHADDAYWAMAVPLPLEGVETWTLCPSHQLIHQIAHGAGWNGFPAVRWAADGVMIIRSGGVDWNEVEAETRRQGLSPVIAEGLGYLQRMLDQPVPDGLVERLTAAPTLRSDRSRLFWETRAREGLMDSARLHWWRLHAAADRSTLRMLTLAPAYIRFRLSTGASGAAADALRALGMGKPRG